MTRAIPGIFAVLILACIILISGCASEQPQVATEHVASATPVHGQVFRDGKPVVGAHVEAVSVDGSQRISNATDDAGAYILGLQPRVWYKITATSGNLKHTILPAYIPEKGNWTSVYDINLTGTSTIEGSPASDSMWKGTGIYLVAAPADGGEPVMAITGGDGNYSLTVKPGVYYTVTATYYDVFGNPHKADIFYRNSIGCTSVKPGRDETVLLDYSTFWTSQNPVQPTLIVNGTVGVLGTKVGPPAPAPVSSVSAGGRAYMNNKTISGASVEAVSIDGADRVTGSTNYKGEYVLDLEPGVLYRATATYNGLKHTIWPVSQALNPADGRNDIYLSQSTKSTIAVFYDDDHPYNSTPTLIEAIPADGSRSVAAATNGSGWYYLDVKPGIKYSLAGRCYDPWGENGGYYSDYPKDGPDRGIILNPDETIVANMGFRFFHPPKSIHMWRDPATGSYDPFKPSIPVTVTGRVFIDDRYADGAIVNATISGTTGNPVSTMTDANGTYTLNLMSRRQYEITATWGAWENTIWPVHVQDYTTGIYDIELLRSSTSFISGTLDTDSKWPVLQGNVITAIPVGGGEPVTAVTGARGNYSLEVKPLTYYDIIGTSPGTDGVNHSIRFYYRNGIYCDGFMLRPYETALIDYRAA